MGAYPTSPRESFIAWCRAHGPVFVERAAVIGLSPEQAEEYALAIAEAIAAEQASAAAAQAARTATQFAQLKVDRLRELTRSSVAQIRIFAQSTDNPEVFNLAQIPVPATPSPLPSPGKPLGLTVGLDPTTGALNLRWKARNPRGAQGTTYIVRRRTRPDAAFEFIGVTGEKRFTDATLPIHPEQLEYTVQGQRGDTAGPLSAILRINFGSVAASAPPYPHPHPHAITTQAIAIPPITVSPRALGARRAG